MATDQWEIRLVRQLDNHVLAQVLRDVLIEMNKTILSSMQFMILI